MCRLELRDVCQESLAPRVFTVISYRMTVQVQYPVELLVYLAFFLTLKKFCCTMSDQLKGRLTGTRFKVALDQDFVSRSWPRGPGIQVATNSPSEQSLWGDVIGVTVLPGGV